MIIVKILWQEEDIITFSLHLFSVVIGVNLLFYYFILTFKKLTVNIVTIYCVSVTMYTYIIFKRKDKKSTSKTGVLWRRRRKKEKKKKKRPMNSTDCQ